MARTAAENLKLEQNARKNLKVLIKRFNLSDGTDKETLQKILDCIASTPLYMPFSKDSTEGNYQVITLTTPDAVFVPLFSSTAEFGKIGESADIKLMAPSDFIPMILELGHHMVVNPFGEYFLLWPEIMREHMLPYLNKYGSFVDKTFSKDPRS